MSTRGSTPRRSRTSETEILAPQNTFLAVSGEEAGEGFRPVRVNVEIAPVVPIPVVVVPDTSWVEGRKQLIIFLIIVIFVAVLLGYFMSL